MAKGLQKYTVQESQNIGLGQAGSIFVNGTTNAVTPPEGSVFVAITIIDDAVFDSGTSGLIGENDNLFPSTVGTGTDIDANGERLLIQLLFQQA